MDTTAFDLRGLTHRFGPRILFQDLSLSVAPGEWVAVTGANGSGKTTLMRILAGLTRPTRGGVRLNFKGHPLAGADLRNAVGFVTPDVTLDADLTARENLRFHARMRDLPPDSEHALLEQVGLGSRGDDRVKTFSSGMRQRLKYAFALQHAPLLLLLDEPTANLDAHGVELVERVKESQRKRGILILATNEAHEAEGATHTIQLGPP